MENLRFIKTEYTYADFSTSISPAIEHALEQGEGESVVLLNIFRGGSFTAGFLDDPEKSLHLDYCREKNIVVRRRQNTGGAIYGPDGGAFIVIYADTRLPWVPLKSIGDTFRITLTNMAHVIRELFGLDAAYRPLNDIEVEGRKLVASSARLEKGILTMRVLLNVVPADPEILTKAIITPVEKTQDKKIKDPGARFTCLEKEIGREVTLADLETLTEKTIQEVFGTEVKLLSGDLTEGERRYAEEYQEKYISDQWFYANSERMRFKDIPSDAVKTEGRHKATAGLIRVTLLTRENRIHDLIITGDFHPTPHQVLQDMEEALRGKACSKDVVEGEIKRIFERDDVEIPGTGVRDFVAAFSKAFEQG